MPERAKRLHRASVALLSGLDLERTQREVVRALKDILSADAAAVMLKDPTGTFLSIESQEGLSDEYARSQRIPYASAKGSFSGSDDHVILDFRTEGFGDRKLVAAEGLAKVLAIPLVNDGEFIGSLNAYLKHRAVEFNLQSIELAHVLAVQASVAIANAQLYREAVRQRDLQKSMFDALGEGIVVVNPTKTSGTVSLGGQYRDLAGTRRTSITLAANTGEVLVKAP